MQPKTLLQKNDCSGNISDPKMRLTNLFPGLAIPNERKRSSSESSEDNKKIKNGLEEDEDLIQSAMATLEALAPSGLVL